MKLYHACIVCIHTCGSQDSERNLHFFFVHCFCGWWVIIHTILIVSKKKKIHTILIGSPPHPHPMPHTVPPIPTPKEYFSSPLFYDFLLISLLICDLNSRMPTSGIWEVLNIFNMFYCTGKGRARCPLARANKDTDHQKKYYVTLNCKNRT